MTILEVNELHKSFGASSHVLQAINLQLWGRYQLGRTVAADKDQVSVTITSPSIFFR
jgi:hypothetical protein